MNRLLYEQSISYQGYLIIPFVEFTINTKSIYSYRLLSELGHKGKFHKGENPAELYSSNLNKLLDLAKQHLDLYSDIIPKTDYFKSRYTYKNNLIIIYHQSDKYFYDHYKPDSLNNIAAPKIFASEQECITWVKAGLDHASSSFE